MDRSELERFKDLTFDDFKRMAGDNSLSPNQKIGFPDSYREGRDEAILEDIRRKLTNLDRPEQTVIDIGPGCGELSGLLIELCREKQHKLFLLDSSEMLDQVSDDKFITKIPGRFPEDCAEFLAEMQKKADVILVYSVFHYVYADGNLFNFVDSTLELMAENSQMLMGDIPNISKRKRFFSSTAGIEFHKKFMGTDQPPTVEFNRVEKGSIDDSVMLAVLARCRAAGCDSYLLPQSPDLPMANRREDILVLKP